MNHKSKVRLYLSWLFIAFALFLLLPPHFFNEPGHGLDPSWRIAIHLAHKYNLIFGKDFVFTYGPLSIFYTRHPIAVSRTAYLVADIYFLGTVAFALCEMLKKWFHGGLIVFAFLAIIINEYESLDVWYYFFYLFFLFSFLKEPTRYLYLIQAALLSFICFYFKVSFGIIALFVFIGIITYMLLRKKLPLKVYVIILSAYLLLLWLSSLALHVYLPGYVKGSMELINDYNDAMFTELFGRYVVLLYAALAILLVILSWIVYRVVTTLKGRMLLQNMDELLIMAIVALSTFIVFKGGFVRSDGHITIFFKAICLTVSLLYLFTGPARKIAALCCWVVMAIAFWGVNAVPGNYLPYRRIINGSFVSINAHELRNYLNECASYDQTLRRSELRGHLSNPFKQVVGDHSVDIMPVEISLAYYNGLKYEPRPVIQSYAAYNAYLDSLNYEKYMSPSAPDYILFDAGGIDDRYAFFDDSKTKLALLSHYKMEGNVGDYMLLKKRPLALPLKPLGEPEIIQAKTGEDIPVKQNGTLQFTKVLIRYNLWGKLKRLFYKPPPIKIIFTLESGETVTYRGIKSLLAGGVLVNKYVDSKEEIPFFLLDGGALNANVKKIRFEAAPGHDGLQPDITLINTYYSLPDKSAPERTEDSIAVANLIHEYDKFKPDAVREAVAENGKFDFSIEQVKTQFRIITIGGWAFNGHDTSKSVKIKTVLKTRDSLYILPTINFPRGDLREYFNLPNIPSAGFITNVSKAHLPAGEYTVGVLMQNSSTGREMIRYGEKKITIKPTFSMARIKKSPATPADTSISYHVESIESQDGQITVRGWAFVRTRNVKPTNTHLLLEGGDGIYSIPTEATSREDLVKAFNDSSLAYSGFMAQLPKDSLPPEQFNIGIEKRYHDGSYCCTVWSDKKIKNIPDTITPSRIASVPAAADLAGNTEALQENDKVFTISGWAIDKADNMRNTTINVILQSNDQVYSARTELVPRPDVERSFKKKFDSPNCGFQARISKDALPKGRYRVGIHVARRGETGHVKFTDKYVEKK